jgi:hypothetical protein
MGRVACGPCSRGLPFAAVLVQIGEVENDTVRGEILGVSRKFVERHRNSAISLKKAEEFADRLGVHPALLWPVEYPAMTRDEEE